MCSPVIILAQAVRSLFSVLLVFGQMDLDQQRMPERSVAADSEATSSDGDTDVNTPQLRRRPPSNASIACLIDVTADNIVDAADE